MAAQPELSEIFSEYFLIFFLTRKVNDDAEKFWHDIILNVE